MSRAFIREDVEPAERPHRARSASRLPPGALNYMTRQGASLIRSRLADLREDADGNGILIGRLEEVLRSAKIVDFQNGNDEVAFGAVVTVENSARIRSTYRLAGVDEIELDSRNISWISPLGKALLSGRPGRRLALPGQEGGEWKVIKIE